MAVSTPVTNTFTLLDNANKPMIRADAGTYTSGAVTLQAELDIIATTGGVSFVPSTFGFATSAQAYFYNAGAVAVVLSQSTTLKVSLAAGTACFVPSLLPTTFSLTSASSTATVYCLLIGI